MLRNSTGAFITIFQVNVMILLMNKQYTDEEIYQATCIEPTPVTCKTDILHATTIRLIPRSSDEYLVYHYI